MRNFERYCVGMHAVQFPATVGTVLTTEDEYVHVDDGRNGCLPLYPGRKVTVRQPATITLTNGKVGTVARVLAERPESDVELTS